MPGNPWPGRIVLGFVILAVVLVEGELFAHGRGADRYRVTGVDATDTLNIRAEPTSSSTVVGKVPSGASGIRALGGRVVAGPSTWIEIQYRDMHGWVNGRYLTREPIRSGSLQMPLRCGGTEPFWDLSVESGAMQFKLSDAQTSFVTSGPIRSANSTQVWSFLVKNGEGAESGVLFVKETGDCSDGMSEHLYDYEVMFNLPEAGGVFSGCCN